ncbi:hypothetical protein LIER_38955 [Lithospermum erythrorhizon]|uniref:GAG-pre-integrase domain-containing protein n=1 Tax=Lithospermum erythrorhizon TaxID=34254 RepID=A0AAV3QBJ3_LITER
MDIYLQQLHFMYSALNDAGDIVKESDLIAQALPTFSAIRPHLLSEDRVNVAKKQMDTLSSLLLYSSMNSSNKTGYTNGSRHSYHAKTRGNGHFQKYRNSSPHSSGSFKGNHINHQHGVVIPKFSTQSDGLLGGAPNAQLSPLKSSSKCQICGMFNHEALECTNWFNHAFTSPKLHKSLVAIHINDSHATEWFPDSGASSHMTGEIASAQYLLSSISPYAGSTKVMVGNGVLLPITHIGYTKIASLHVKHVHYVSTLNKNLISIQQLCDDNNCIVEFSHSDCFVKDQKTKTLLLHSSNSGSLYPINCPATVALTAQTAATSSSFQICHQRLGHPILDLLVRNKLIDCTSKTDNHYNVCQLGKQAKQPFSNSITLVHNPFELVYSNLWESPTFIFH